MKVPDEERAGSDLDAAVPSILGAEMCGSLQPGRWTQLLRVLGVRADPWLLEIDARGRRKEAVQDTAAEPPPGSAVLAPAWLWALVPLAGWTILLALWLLFDWRSGVPGLFDYRSATLGYAIFLPLAWWASAHAVARLPGDDSWRTHVGPAVLGAAVALGIQAIWLLDPKPTPNWSFPEAHHFNGAGWYHAGYLAVVSAGSAVLAAALIRRLRAEARREPPNLRALAAGGWLDVAAFGGATLVGLAAVDNATAHNTQAGLASYAGLALVAVALVVAVAGRRPARRERLIALARGVAGAAGVSALAAHGIPHLSLAEGVFAVVAVVVLTIGVLAAHLGERSLSTAVSAASVISLGLGAVGLGLHLVLVDQSLLVAVVVLSAAVAVGLITRLGAGSASDRLLGGTAVAFTYGLIVLAGWLHGPGRGQLDAHYSLGFATFFLDGLVIGLIRERFGDVVRVDRRWYEGQVREAEEEATGTATTLQVVCFGIAAIISLVLLHVAAARVLRADRGAGVSHLSAWVLVGAFGAAVLLLLVAYLIASRTRRPYRPPTLAVSPAAALVAIAALSVWCAAALSQIDDPQIPGFAAIGASFVAVMTFEDLLRSPARLQLQDPGLWGRLVAIAGAATIFISLFLILSTALWDGSRPVGSGDAAVAGIGLLLGTAILVTLAAGPLAAALRIPKLTPEPPWQNVALIQALYAALALIGLVLPAFVVGRIELHHPENVGLATVSALAPLPALLGALIWVLHTNSEHLRGQRPDTVPADIAAQIEREEEALRLNHCRLAWLAAHVNFQNRAATALVAGGGIWMVLRIAL